MTDDVEFWNKLAPRYAKLPIGDPDGYAYTLGRTKTYLAEGDRVLEIGGGTGSTAIELAPNVAEYKTTDISQGMTEIAREKIALAGHRNLTAETARLEDIETPEVGYDAVLALNLIHLLPNLEDALAGISALTRPGGLFIQKTPMGFDGRVPLKFRLMQGVIPIMQLFGRAPDTVVFPKPAHMEKALDAAGFEIIELHIDSGFPPRQYIVARKKLT